MNDGIKRVRSVDFNVVLNDGCEAVIHYSVVGSATIA